MKADKSLQSLRRRLAEVTARKDLLEDTLRDVWLWHATDGLPDELRLILLRADQNAHINNALDRLAKEDR